MVAVGEFLHIHIQRILASRRFFDGLVRRKHIQRHHIQKAVVVHIGHIAAHRKVACVGKRILDRFAERAVLVIDVIIIVLVEVVGNINVVPAVVVQVGHGNAQPVAHGRLVDPRFLAYVLEKSLPQPPPKEGAFGSPFGGGGGCHLVFKQVVAGLVVLECPGGNILVAAGRVHGVREQVHIQVAILVMVKKGGLRGKSREVQAIIGGFFGKGQIAIVYVEFIGAFQTLVIAHGAHVNIQQAVAVHIGHGHTGFPVGKAFDTRFLRDILKLEAALVQVQFVFALVGHKKQVGQPVVVHIAGGHSGSVVIIEVVQDIEFAGVLKPVDESDVGLYGIQLLEQCFFGGFTVATEQCY